jgi:hypothetical protein
MGVENSKTYCAIAACNAMKCIRNFRLSSIKIMCVHTLFQKQLININGVNHNIRYLPAWHL